MKSLHQGEILKQLVDTKGYTDEDFAKKMDVTRQTVSTWYTKKSLPMRRINTIANALNISPSVFFQENVNITLTEKSQSYNDNIKAIENLDAPDSEKIRLLKMIIDRKNRIIDGLQSEIEIQNDLIELMKAKVSTSQ